ncbi:MAG: FHA domain-containing protein [Acidobacteriota bacterium]
MKRCFHCGTDNMSESEYCDECGARLGAVASPRTPNYSPPQPPPPPTFTRESVTPRQATPYTPPPPAPPVRRSGPIAASQEQARPGINAQSAFRPQTSPLSSGEHYAQQEGDSLQSEVHAKLIIQRGGKVGKEFFLNNPESLIGRWDADGGIFPDVDLDQDDPEAKISRRHARIHFLNNQFLIEDLGSTNGTFINRGPRLLPGNKQPLKHGDEIIVGKTFLKFVLN